MAPKRPPPLEEPPSASETEEEEDLDGSEEEYEDEDEDEDEVEPPKPVQTSLKNPKPKPNPTRTTSLPKPQPQPPSSSDDSDDDETPNPNSSSKPKPNPPQEEEDSDPEEETSDSDSDNEPVKHMIAQRSADAKPISSKPMPAATKSNKPPPATPVPSKPAPKRPLDDGKDKDKRSAKKKKVSETDDEGDHNTTDGSHKKTAGDDKKPLAPFQRLWTDENEIILLKGLIDFKKNGYNVSTNLGAYYDFIKDSLRFDVTKPQLNNKVQKLKHKYQANASKAKPGEDPLLSRPHETEAYMLSKEIWGEGSRKDDAPHANHVGSESGKRDAKKNKTPTSIALPKQKISKPSPKQKIFILPDETPPKVEGKEDTGSGSEYNYLNQSLKFRNGPTMPVPPQNLGVIVAEKGWDSAKTFDATSLNKRWKEVMIAETKAYLVRLDLVREQTKLMLDELVSADS